MGQKASSHHQSVRNILLIANTSLASTRQYLQENSHKVSPAHKYRCYSYTKYLEGETEVIAGEDNEVLARIELVIVIGENRDLMFAYALFRNRHTPPILGLGNTEDFTSPLIYNFSLTYADDLTELVFDQENWQNLPCDNLMKLSLGVDCKKIGEATCQVQIHRGMNQSILILNIFLQNSCDEEKIKIGEFRGDGLLISTPMGSYCKSLSLNGPLMDRTMENIMITPICPLSMKFRPLCLPASSIIFIQLDDRSRTPTADIYIDENCRYWALKKRQQLRIRMSKFRTRMISNLIETSQEYFIRSLRDVLGWGESYSHLEHLPKKRESNTE